MFNINLDASSAFKKDRTSLNKDMRKKKKIKKVLEQLSKNPFDSFFDIKKLQPKSNNKFRLKIQNYRIIYSIDFGNKIILIHRIAHRKDIYK